MMKSPYLPAAPIHDPVITEDNKLEDKWKNHFDSISENFGYVVVNDRLTSTKRSVPVTMVIRMSQTNRNLLENARDGSIIYNTTTNRFNFRENGAWVTFAPIPA